MSKTAGGPLHEPWMRVCAMSCFSRLYILTINSRFGGWRGFIHPCPMRAITERVCVPAVAVSSCGAPVGPNGSISTVLTAVKP